MPAIPNPKLIFSSVPSLTEVEVDKHLTYDTSSTIDLDNITLRAGGLLVRSLSFSLDPYMREKMAGLQNAHFSEAYEIGSAIYNFGVVEILASNNKDFPAGKVIYGIFPFQLYSVLSVPATHGEVGRWRIIENKEGLDWTTWVGWAGMAGKTAFYGWKAFSKAKKGEKVFVSSAGGVVGSLVCQLAKLDGLQVIASAGSDDKVKYLKETLGVDRAFNYKTTSTSEQLAAFGGIDIFWDGVGGQTLDDALGAMHTFGRLIECGMITSFTQGEEGQAFRNMSNIFGRCLTLNGFLVYQFEDEMAADFYAFIPSRFASGELIKQETIVAGLEGVPKAFVGMMKGKTGGKVVVKV